MSGTERQRELRRLRGRKKKLTKMQAKLRKASASEKETMVTKLRKLSPGAERLIADWGLKA